MSVGASTGYPCICGRTSTLAPAWPASLRARIGGPLLRLR